MALDAFNSIVNVALDTVNGGSQGGEAGSSLQIQQVEGSNPITVILRGRAMPYRAPDYEVTQRNKTTWYPGASVATQQVFGPQEMPSTFQGKWKDRFIPGSVVVNGDENQIDTAEKAIELFNLLTRSGRQVRVQWASWVRTGLLDSFKQTPDRIQDIAWTMKFTWASRDDEQAKRTSEDPGTPSDLTNLMNLIDDIVTLAPDVAAAFAAAIVESVNQVRERTATLFNLLRVAETVVNLPADTLGAIRSSNEALSRELTDLLFRVSNPRPCVSPGATAIKGATVSPTRSTQNALSAAPSSSSTTQELQLEQWRRSVGIAAARLRFASQKQTSAQTERLRPKATQVVTVTQRKSLYTISTEFYGSPDFANFLAIANRLSSVIVQPGTQLRVPPRPFGSLAQANPSAGPRNGC